MNQRKVENTGGQMITKILLLLNITTVCLLGYWISKVPVAGPAVAPAVEVTPLISCLPSAPDPGNPGAEEVTRALRELRSSVEHLSSDLRRINLTGIQYAYLTRDVMKLDHAARLVDGRMGALRTEGVGRNAEAAKTIEKLETLRKDLRNQISQRETLIQKLVNHLESGLNTGQSSPVPAKTGDGTIGNTGVRQGPPNVSE